MGTGTSARDCPDACAGGWWQVSYFDQLQGCYDKGIEGCSYYSEGKRKMTTHVNALFNGDSGGLWGEMMLRAWRLDSAATLITGAFLVSRIVLHAQLAPLPRQCAALCAVSSRVIIARGVAIGRRHGS